MRIAKFVTSILAHNTYRICFGNIDFEHFWPLEQCMVVVSAFLQPLPVLMSKYERDNNIVLTRERSVPDTGRY